MVFGRKYDIFHTGSFCSISPFLGIEIDRIERLPTVFVILYIFDIGFTVFRFALGPAFIFRANTPTFNDSPLAIGSPVHKKPELHVLPLFQVLEDLWVGWFLITCGDIMRLAESQA